MYRLMLALMILLVTSAAPQLAGAYTCSGATCTDTATWNEPTTCLGGSVLLGTGTCPALQESDLQWNLNGGPNTLVVTPASKPGGGGSMTQVISGIPVAPCTKATHNVSLTEKSSGGVSPPITFSLLLDRTVLPGTTTPDPSCVTPGPVTNFQLN